jgi:Mn-containing catalase
MYHHVKKLMYTVRVDEPDPAFGNMLLEQFGGANGELAAAIRSLRYGTLKTWANQFGLRQAVKLLDKTLAEEKKTDDRLSALAQTAVNAEAA